MKQVFEYTSESAEQTFAIGETIGSYIKEGITILLYGGLGSGKTCFVQGLGRGLEIPEKYYITSPTFTLINEYAGKLNLFHVDLYRIENLEDLESIGLYELFDDMNVVAVEWSEKLKKKFFNDYITGRFEFLSETARKIKFEGFGKKGVNLMDNIIRGKK